MKHFLYLFFSILTLSSCSQSAKENTVDVATFEKGIAETGIQILDVRTAEEFKTGHIKNALQANYNNIKEFKERVQYLNKNQPIYIYCLSGVRSEYAMSELKEMGFTKLYHLKGGINAWKRSNKPLEGITKTTQLTQVEFQQKITADNLVLVDFGADWCPPCIKMKPILTEVLQAVPQAKLLNVDGGVDLQLMEQFKVEALPVFIIFKNGQQVWRKQGVVSAEELKLALTK